jgi:prepilin-type N-terminal cleavage/methylation domain-containing protein
MMHYCVKKHTRRGFTLIELAVVVSIVALLAGILLSRGLYYQEQAEKVAIEQTLGTLRSALHLQVAGLLLNGKADEIAHLPDQNPMDWLAEKPKNYVGEYYTPKPGMVAPGNWYFDLQNKNLVYLVNNREHLHTAVGEGNQIRFRAKLVTALNDASAPQKDAGKPTENLVEGVVLEPVISYKWF